MSEVPGSYFTPTVILLPTDFSASSDAALEVATGLAQHFHAELLLLHVIHTTLEFTGADFFPETSILEEAKSGIEKQLTEHVASLHSHGIRSAYKIKTGNDVAGEIVHMIEREHIDMIVISTHGVSGWRPAIFGSIAEKLIRLVRCPLLLLHSAEASIAS